MFEFFGRQVKDVRKSFNEAVAKLCQAQFKLGLAKLYDPGKY